MSSKLLRTIEAILAARRGEPFATCLDDLTAAEAYEVQAVVLNRLSEAVGGWKVAIVEGKPVAAPLMASSLLHSDCSLHLKMRMKTTYKIETELGFRLCRELPPRTLPYTRDDVIMAIDTVHAVFEVVGARFGEPPEVGFPTFLADNLGNAYTIVGPGSALQALPDCVFLNKNRELYAQGTHPNKDPLAPLFAYANRQSDALGGLRTGQLVITGSYHRAVPVSGGALFEGSFDRLPSVRSSFVGLEFA